MTVTCKNCKNEYSGHFCNQCGQEAATHKINLHFMWHDIQHGLLHIDKGILYTLKELFTRPGLSIREFIEGKRVNHFKPISLVIVLATLYGFLYRSFHISEVPEINKAKNGLSSATLENINEWASSHVYLIQILSIPFYAIGSYLCFRRQGYNYIEHIIINSFLAGQRLFLFILCFPILIYVNNTHHVFFLEKISTGVNALLYVWTFSTFFNHLSFMKTFFLSLLSYFLFWVCFILIVSIGVLLFL